jgi:hypothetical protein
MASFSRAGSALSGTAEVFVSGGLCPPTACFGGRRPPYEERGAFVARGVLRVQIVPRHEPDAGSPAATGGRSLSRRFPRRIVEVRPGAEAATVSEVAL